MGYFIEKGSPAKIVKESDFISSLDIPYIDITTTKHLCFSSKGKTASFEIGWCLFIREGWVMHIKNDLISPEKTFFGARTFTVTGTIEGLSRVEVQNIIENFGGKYEPLVSSKTDILIVGDDQEGANIGVAIAVALATRLGVHIMTEADFLKLIS